MIQKFEEGRDSDGGKKAKADSSEEAGGQSRKKKNEYEGADARKRNARMSEMVAPGGYQR